MTDRSPADGSLSQIDDEHSVVIGRNEHWSLRAIDGIESYRPVDHFRELFKGEGAVR